MKNSKGQELQQFYRDLAMMRMEQQKDSDYVKMWHKEFEVTQLLKDAFCWDNTPEKGSWWEDVYFDETPEIPASSLAELEAWRKQREESKQSDFWGKAAMVADELRPEPDYKAMYEELEVKYKDLQWTFSELREQKIELEKRAENTTTPTRNWIAECAMVVMQGLLSDPNYKDVQHTIAGNIVTKPRPEVIAERSFDYAEAWAAEGKKRGHLPNR